MLRKTKNLDVESSSLMDSNSYESSVLSNLGAGSKRKRVSDVERLTYFYKD